VRAGLPGLVAACGGLLALLRRKRTAPGGAAYHGETPHLVLGTLSWIVLGFGREATTSDFELTLVKPTPESHRTSVPFGVRVGRRMVATGVPLAT
jgi:hypothetical protein